jgi:TonB family protein
MIPHAPRLVLAALLAALAPLPLAARMPQPVEGQMSLKAVRMPMPSFPDRMLMEGVHNGSVRLMLEVDESGTIVDHLLLGYSHRPFAAAATGVLRHWKFEPTAAVHVIDLTLNFATRGVVVVVKRHESSVASTESFVNRLCPPAQLDRPVRPVSLVQPAYSTQMESEGAVGSVTVTYYIDEQGRVRMPFTEDGQPLLAALAVAAVREWRFEPPTCHGRPTLVRATQTFNFGGVAVTNQAGRNGDAG